MTSATMLQHYSMILEWDANDRMYIVTVPELPGCRTHGNTRVEAVSQGEDAIETWLDGMRAWASPIPEPKLYDLAGLNRIARDQRTNGVS